MADGIITIEVQVGTEHATVPLRNLQSTVEKINGKSVDNLESSLNKAGRSASEASSKTKDLKDNTEKVSETPFMKLKDALSGFKDKLTGASNDTKTLGKDIKNADDGDFNKTKRGLKDVDDQTDKTKSHFSMLKDIVAGTFLGNAISNGVSMLASGLKNIAGSGFSAAQEINELDERWKNIGVNNGGIKQLNSQMDELKANSNLSFEAVTNLQTRFFDMTHSVAATKTLTQGVASLADQLRLSKDKTDSFATTLNRIETQSKVSAQSFGRLERAAPGISTAMQQASGLSQKAFDQLISSGKMTSTQFNDILEKASGSYKKNSAEFDSTGRGALNHLQQAWDATKANLMKPLVSVEGTGLSAINKILDSKVIQNGVSAIGQGIANVAKWLSQGIGYASKFLSSFSKASSTNKLMSVLKGSVSDVVSVFRDGQKLVMTFWDSFSKSIAPVTKNLSAITDQLVKILQPAMQGIMRWFSKNMPTIESLFRVLGKTAGQALNFITTTFRNLLSVVQWLIKRLQPAFKILGTLFTDLVKVAKNAFKLIGDVFQVFADLFSGHFNKLGKDLRNIWNDAMHLLVSIFKSSWDTMRTIFSAFVGVFGTLFKDVLKGWEIIFKSIWNGISHFFGDIWNDISRTGSRAWNALGRGLGNALNGISSGWNKMWRGVRDFFGGIWDDIKGTARSAINGVIDIINGGIRAIDAVIHTFGGKKYAIGLLNHVGHFATGTKGAPKGLAMVNDGAGQEIIIDNKKQAHVLEGKNRLVNFEGGETVIPYEASKQFGQVVSHFASGTWGWLGGIGDWLKDKWNSLTKFIAHPIQALESTAMSVISGSLGGSSQLVSGLADSLGHGLINGIEAPFKALLSGLKKKHDESEEGAPAGKGVQRWRSQAERALEMNGLSTSLVNKILRQIQTESGGNERAVQGGYTDVNTISGDLAKGLMQTISATFNAYAFPGHHNIFNGFDNMLAAINYAKHRYGSSLSGLGEGHGYADGGWVTGQNQYVLANDGGYQEMILSSDPAKRAHTMALLQDFLKKTHLTAEKTIDANVAQSGQSVGSSSVTNNYNTLNFHFDKLIWNNAEDIRKTAQKLGWDHTITTRGSLA
ncbi:MAG: tape measure protein [Oenococcus sp.]|uniref:tape measure protein n=1 Tax=Oenococcus sp. TaxID=1979414 RepID=UPI0039EC1AEE